MNYSKILKILIYVLLSVSPITGFTESHEISRRLIPSDRLIIDSSSPAPGAEINLVRIACNVKTHRGDAVIIKISESRLACISNPVSFSSEYRGGSYRLALSMDRNLIAGLYIGRVKLDVYIPESFRGRLELIPAAAAGGAV